MAKIDLTRKTKKMKEGANERKCMFQMLKSLYMIYCSRIMKYVIYIDIIDNLFMP